MSWQHTLAVRKAVENAREWRAIWDEDRDNALRRKEQRPNMPRTPQGDMRREQPDFGSLGSDIDGLYDSAVEALDAATAAAKRQTDIDTIANGVDRERFPRSNGASS